MKKSNMNSFWNVVAFLKAKIKNNKKKGIEAKPSLFLLLFLSTLSIFAQPEKSEDKTLSPYFFVKSNDPSNDQLPLKSTQVDVNIAGVIADVSVKQVYNNSGKSTIEAIYVFPASSRAAVYAMKMKVGNRLITAVVKEKEQARADYEAAKAQGKTASLLEEERPNVFQMNVANILPGDTIEVTMNYTELLVPESGIYEFIFPTVVGPRYSNKTEGNAKPDEKWVASSYTKEGEAPLSTFDIKVKINSGLPIREISCGTHETKIDYAQPTLANISLSSKNKNEGNRDYILKYKLADEQIGSGILLYEGQTENFFLAMIQPPARRENIQIPPREYIFIVDVSGSMSGFPLNVSKTLLRNLISNLRPIDKFNLLLFAGGSTLMAPQSIMANQENIGKAINVIDNQHGGGGTELLPALKTAMSVPTSNDFSRTFVIATDGYISVEKESFELIQDNLDKANFFAFGIGSSVNRFLIEGIAHVGMGIPFIVTNEKDAEIMAEKLKTYIQTPALTRIKVDYQGFDVYDVEPKKVPDLLAERPIIIFGKYKGKASGSIKLSGLTEKNPYENTINVANVVALPSNAALKYLWARQKIQIMDDFYVAGRDEKMKKEVTELGIKYNLLTKYTSFIAIDSVSRNKDGKYTSVNQPLPLPQGVSNNAIDGESLSYSYSSGSGKVKSARVNAGYSEPERKEDFSNNSKIPSETDVTKPPVTNKLTDTIPDPTKTYTVVDELPSFIGGYSAMMDYIRKNMVYPESAKKKGLQGMVYMSFIVNYDGTISDVKVARGFNSECDAEALRFVKTMTKMWNPAKIKGHPVGYQMSLPLKFPTL